MFSRHRITRFPGPKGAPATWCKAMLLVLRGSNPAGGSPLLASKRTPPVVDADSKGRVEVLFGVGELVVTRLVAGLCWCRFRGCSPLGLGAVAESPPQDKMRNDPRMKKIRDNPKYTEVASPKIEFTQLLAGNALPKYLGLE